MKPYLFLCLFWPLLCLGQQFDGDTVQTPVSEWKERIFFWPSGGGFISDNGFLINLAPVVGYRVTPRLSAGVGFTYIYERFRFEDLMGRERVYNLNSYGGRIISQLTLTRNIFFQGEYELMNLQLQEGIRVPREAILLGGGVFTQIGRNSFVNIALLYNVNHNSPRALYQGILIPRIGFNFGIW